ncbi:hypothetical protein SPSIL_017020 [Sporomusa silvacetica DSM 10669]|uniref:Uncharacterized protein n=1 Tax=Sporomusa silvacetica DSM 10669 TaxID=1123289 RepID=A0ABZ3IJB3_9FIRM|nr:hypothetical protein [Sporomusa silvacetica]OZC18355.1 hypothetical protein SPSIL_25550 [Sporomusa silvacetica DSM 10669]
MNTSDIVSLIQQNKLSRGVYTVNIKPGAYTNVLGNKILVYTNSKPDSDILAFGKQELLLVIDSAKSLPVEQFKNLITAKQFFNGTIEKG